MLQMRRFNMGAVGEADCPVFDGLFDYCAVRSSSSCSPAKSSAAACRLRFDACCQHSDRAYLLTQPQRAVQMYSGASVGGASLLNNSTADIVLNWAGAKHHCFCKPA